jgi:hypothetical protein
VKKVVILACYRGGSTFVGSVFNQNDDAFYWFEPLMAPLVATNEKGSAFRVYQNNFIEDKQGKTLK